MTQAFSRLSLDRDGNYPDGRKRYRLALPFMWSPQSGDYQPDDPTFEGYGVRNQVTSDLEVCFAVPSRFDTDLASIPPVFFMLDPADKRWAGPAVIHDWSCDMARAGKWTMRRADQMLYDAMIDNGNSKAVAYAFWAFVRARHKLRGDG